MSDVLDYVYKRVQTDPVGKSKTKQSPRDQVDINAIVKRWQSTGVLEEALGEGPTYGDFTGVEDYLSAALKVQAADEQFAQLPAHIRDHCENDAGKFLAFVFDPDNAAELVELGLKDLSESLHGPLPAAPVVPVVEPDPKPVEDPKLAPVPEVTGGE